MFLSIYAKGLHFGFLGNLGTFHQTPQIMEEKEKVRQKEIFKEIRDGIEDVAEDMRLVNRIEDENDTWGQAFDWSVGVYGGYRFDLAHQGFFDWNFFDFSHGISFFSSMRLGKHISDRVSVYVLLTPCVLLSSGMWGVSKLLKKSKSPTEVMEALNYRGPFMGLGVSAGLGVNYRLTNRVDLVGQWSFQGSYCDLAYASRDLLNSGTTAGQVAQILLIAFTPNRSQIIRQRISLGIELHGADYVS